MKIAIIISGYLRTFQLNLENFINNVIKDHDADIYLHKINDENQDRYINNNSNWDKIKEVLKPKLIIETSNFKIHTNKKMNDILNQFNKFKILNDLKNKIMNDEKIKYDVVVKWRPDILINTKLDFEKVDKDIIYIPEDSKIDNTKLNDGLNNNNNNNNNLCDIIAYGDNNAMNKYFNIYNGLETLIEKYGFCQEKILYYYLQNIQYKQMNIDYCIVLSRCNVISITGNSGSGKTELSNYLNRDNKSSFVLECDRYHKWERNNELWNKYTHLNTEANYLTKMQKDVFDLKIGKDVYQVNYDHTNGKFTDNEHIESKDTMIVCGLHTFYNKWSNLNIYIDTSEELNKYWKVKRDIKKRGYTVEKVLETIEKRKSDYNKYVLPQKNKADIIINFYTEDEISFNDLTKEYKIRLNIYVKRNFDITKIENKLKQEISDLKIQDKYFKLIIKDNIDYYNIIKIIINDITL
jgi:uridine kinase